MVPEPGHGAVVHRCHPVIGFVVSQTPLVVFQTVGFRDEARDPRDLHGAPHASHLGLGRVRVQLWPAVDAVTRVQCPVTVHGSERETHRDKEHVPCNVHQRIHISHTHTHTCIGRPCGPRGSGWRRFQRAVRRGSRRKPPAVRNDNSVGR